MAVPVHVVSGFLGAGKTTAIQEQLRARRGERVAVIVNDFGEASLDEASLREAAPFRITNIAGACVCCTAPEGFAEALTAVLEGEPDRLLIEPTGLARPQDLVDTIRRGPHRERLGLGPVVVLLDPRRLAEARGDEERVMREQVEAADVLVANRTDLCSAADLARFDAWLEDLWPEPLAVHRTSHGRVPPELFEWPPSAGPRLPRAAEGRESHAGHAHGASTEGFEARSFVWSPELVFSRERLLAALERMSQREGLVRFKGIFRTREGVLRLEVAGGRRHEDPSAHRADSRADAIFRAGAGGPEAAGRWLADAVLDERELRAGAEQIEVAFPGGRTRVVEREGLLALPGGVDDVSALVPGRRGSAARVAALLESLGIDAEGEAVVCASDGFASEPVPLSALREGLILHSLEGEPLAASAGGPFRLLIPEGVPGAPSGCANVKGVTRIVLREGAPRPD